MRKNRRKVIELISKLSKELKIEESTVWYFLAADIERIIDEKINLHSSKLVLIENNISELREKEQRILSEILFKEKQLIREENELLNKINSRKESLLRKENEKQHNLNLKENEIERISNNINLLEEKIESKKSEIIILKEKLVSITNEYNNTEKVEKKLKYNIMMGIHKIKEKTDSSHKFVKIIVGVFTIIGIILALYFILTKN